jgi:hypothetical protein
MAVNANSLHDVALICLAEPVMTMLPTLDTSTHVYPYNTADAAGGRRTNVVAVGRFNNNVDLRYPQGMGKSQDLFRTNTQRTDAVAEQSLPDSDYRKIRDVFLVPTPNLKAVTDPGDSGGPVFLAGSGTSELAPRHQVVGLVSRDVINYRNRVPVYRAVAFSRLDDPNVAAWLQTEITHCNSSNPPSLMRMPIAQAGEAGPGAGEAAGHGAEGKNGSAGEKPSPPPKPPFLPVSAPAVLAPVWPLER